MSDAGILASTTLIPSIVWAFLWSLLSTLLLGLGALYALREPIPSPRGERATERESPAS